MIFIILTISYLITMGIALYFLINNFKHDRGIFEFLLIIVEAAVVSFIYFALSYVSFIY